MFKGLNYVAAANPRSARALVLTGEPKEDAMKRLLFAAVAFAALVAAAPASAGGVGVRVGPLGVGVGPSYDPYWRDHHYGYGAADCRVFRERIVTPSGRVIFRTHRTCD